MDWNGMRFTLLGITINKMKGKEYLNKKKIVIELRKTLLKQKMGYSTEQEGVFIARRRHLDSLQAALFACEQAKLELTSRLAGELVAQNLKEAQDSLSEITGEFSADDLLGKIFGEFCIGK